MKLSLICAMAENRVIGRNNRLPWHLVEDLKYFKRTTMGCPIIMGRKTWESIGRPLPGRTNIIVTGNPDYAKQKGLDQEPKPVRVTNSLNEAYSLAQQVASSDGSSEAFVIGGATLYESALKQADCIHLTRVHAEVKGDTYFPEFDESQWREVRKDTFEADEENPFSYSISLLVRNTT